MYIYKYIHITHLKADAALLGAALEHLIWRRDLQEQLIPPAVHHLFETAV